MNGVKRNESAMRNRGRRSATLALLTFAAVVLSAGPVAAGWQQAAEHAVLVEEACRDGLRLRIAGIDFGSGATTDARLQVADPVVEPAEGAAYEPTREELVLDRRVALQQLTSARQITFDAEPGETEPQTATVRTYRRLTVRFSRTVKARERVLLTPRPFGQGSETVRVKVGACRLFPLRTR